MAAALGGGVRYDVEYRVVRPTGEVRFVRSQGDVFRDDAGQPRRLFGTMQDNAFFTTKPGGMGMGLSISQSIIDAHGGRLWATANATRGVTLYFALPVLEEVPPETDAARPA